MTIATIPIAERLDRACVRTLCDGITAATAAQARVLVIDGAPGRFCLGMDFTRLPERDELRTFAAMVRALLLAPMPTLAVIDGPALGGGLGIAAACDYVLASERATFGLPEALYGLAPAIIRPALLGRLTPQRLRMLVVTCHSRSAREALALGLVDELVHEGEIATARARAIRQLRRARADSVVTLRAWEAADLERRLSAGVEETSTAIERPSVRAAIAAEELRWG